MKVSELIKRLQTFNPDLQVKLNYMANEDDYYNECEMSADIRTIFSGDGENVYLSDFDSDDE